MYALSRFSFLLLPCMQAVVTGIYINYRSAALSRFARARAVAYARPHAQGVGTLSARVASRLANSLLLATLILSHLVVSRKERKPYKIVNYLPFVYCLPSCSTDFRTCVPTTIPPLVSREQGSCCESVSSTCVFL